MFLMLEVLTGFLLACLPSICAFIEQCPRKLTSDSLCGAAPEKKDVEKCGTDCDTAREDSEQRDTLAKLPRLTWKTIYSVSDGFSDRVSDDYSQFSFGDIATPSVFTSRREERESSGAFPLSYLEPTFAPRDSKSSRCTRSISAVSRPMISPTIGTFAARFQLSSNEKKSPKFLRESTAETVHSNEDGEIMYAANTRSSCATGYSMRPTTIIGTSFERDSARGWDTPSSTEYESKTPVRKSTVEG